MAASSLPRSIMTEDTRYVSPKLESWIVVLAYRFLVCPLYAMSALARPFFFIFHLPSPYIPIIFHFSLLPVFLLAFSRFPTLLPPILLSLSLLLPPSLSSGDDTLQPHDVLSGTLDR